MSGQQREAVSDLRSLYDGNRLTLPTGLPDQAIARIDEEVQHTPKATSLLEILRQDSKLKGAQTGHSLLKRKSEALTKCVINT